MNLEYLIVGIAKENQEDLAEFYEKTHCAAYALALSYVKDRFLSRAIVTEAYRRVKKYAYKFDTDMNAEYWLLDIVKNISANALCDGELAALAEERHLENVSNLVRNAILDTAEDRGKILMLRTCSSLSKSEIASLLWYNKASCNGEFSRGVNELVQMAPAERNKAAVKAELAEHIAECVPSMLEEINSDRETVVSKVSHKNYLVDDGEYALPGESKENRRQRIEVMKSAARKKKIITVGIVAAVVCVLAAGGLVWWFIENGDTALKDPEQSYDVTEPQYDTDIALAEKDGVLYYQNYADNGYLYSVDMTADNAKPVKLCEREIDELIAADGYLYYRSESTIYRLKLGESAKTAEQELAKGTSISICEGKLYYHSKSGISRMDLDGKNVENIHDVQAPYVKATEGGIVYYSLGANGDAEGQATANFFRLVPSENGYYEEQLGASGVYDFQLQDGAAYYDVVNVNFDTERTSTGSIYQVKVSDGIVQTEKLTGVLLSAAFYIDGDNIYYYGCKEIDDSGKPIEKGIYQISVALTSDGGRVGGTPRLLVPMNDSKYDVSDMYVGDGYLYCYECSGEKEDPHAELKAYKIADNGEISEKSVKIDFFKKG